MKTLLQLHTYIRFIHLLVKTSFNTGFYYYFIFFVDMSLSLGSFNCWGWGRRTFISFCPGNGCLWKLRMPDAFCCRNWWCYPSCPVLPRAGPPISGRRRLCWADRGIGFPPRTLKRNEWKWMWWVKVERDQRFLDKKRSLLYSRVSIET